MRVVYKYVLEAGITNTISLPVGAKVLDVKIQRNDFCIWILLDPQAHNIVNRKFVVIGTGMIFDVPIQEHVGTVMTDDHAYVFHIFEVK